jgi:hypothetical protein
VADDGLDGGAAPEFAFDDRMNAALLEAHSQSRANFPCAYRHWRTQKMLTCFLECASRQSMGLLSGTKIVGVENQRQETI